MDGFLPCPLPSARASARERERRGRLDAGVHVGQSLVLNAGGGEGGGHVVLAGFESDTLADWARA